MHRRLRTVAVHTLVSLEHEIGGRLLLQRAIAQRQAGNGGDIGIAVQIGSTF